MWRRHTARLNKWICEHITKQFTKPLQTELIVWGKNFYKPENPLVGVLIGNIFKDFQEIAQLEIEIVSHCH